MDKNLVLHGYQCKIISVKLNRIIPTPIFLTWMIKKTRGQTKTQITSQYVYFNESFSFTKYSGESINIIFGLHSISADNFSIKFTEFNVQLPNYTKKKGKSSCSLVSGSIIGNVELNIEFEYSGIVDVSEEENIQTVNQLCEKYSDIISSIDPLVKNEIDIKRYISSEHLLRDIQDNLDNYFTIEAKTTLDNAYKSLKFKSRQINVRFDMLYRSIIALLHKDMPYISDDLTILRLEDHNKVSGNKYPVAGVAICHTIDNFFNVDLMFDDETIDQMLMDVVNLFMGLISNTDTSEMRFLYLMSSMYFILAYTKKLYSGRLENFYTMIVNTLKQAALFFIDAVFKTLPKSLAPNSFIMLMNQKTFLFESGFIPKDISFAMRYYIFQRYDYEYVINWIESSELVYMHPSTFPRSDFLYEWTFLSNLDIIVKKADAIVAQKFDLSMIDDFVRGSLLKKTLEKLIALKKLRSNRKQLDMLNFEDDKKGSIAQMSDFLENNFDKFIGIALPEKLPQIDSFFST